MLQLWVENMSLMYHIISGFSIPHLLNNRVIAFWIMQTYHKFGDAAFSLTRFFKDKDTGGGSFKPSSAVATAAGGFLPLGCWFLSVRLF